MHHVYDMKHLIWNLIKLFGKCNSLGGAWSCHNAKSKTEYDSELKIFKENNMKAAEYMNALDHNKWCVCLLSSLSRYERP